MAQAVAHTATANVAGIACVSTTIWCQAAIVPAQSVINHAAESDLCHRVRVKRFKVNTKVKTPATLEWVNAFMAEASEQLGALALFMFLTGARVSEALSVEWSAVNLKARKVTINQSKIGAERVAHLPPSLVAALANLPRVKGRPIFWYRARSNIVMVWRRAAKRAGIALLSPHCCRHGFATALLQAGIDPVTIAKLGGWKSARHVFETYGHASDDPTLTDRIAGTQLTHDTQHNSTKARKTGTK